jgi:hypothetical protein
MKVSSFVQVLLLSLVNLRALSFIMDSGLVVPAAVPPLPGRERPQKAITAPASFSYSTPMTMSSSSSTEADFLSPVSPTRYADEVVRSMSSLLAPAIFSIANAVDASARSYTDVLSVLKAHAVTLRSDADSLRQAVKDLTSLINALKYVPLAPDNACTGRGFFLSEANGNVNGWKHASAISHYHTLPPHTSRDLPPLNSKFIGQSLYFAQQVLQQHLRASPKDCYCLQQTNPMALINNALEQLMIVQSTEALRQSVDVERWNKAHDPLQNKVLVPGHSDARIRLLRNRDEYAHTAVNMCLAATSNIQISTCYLDRFDPFVCYLLLDLLPHCAKQNPSLQIHVLVDWMTIESALVKSAFIRVDQPGTSTNKPSGEITETSFIRRLPLRAPLAAS